LASEGQFKRVMGRGKYEALDIDCPFIEIDTTDVDQIDIESICGTIEELL